MKDLKNKKGEVVYLKDLYYEITFDLLQELGNKREIYQTISYCVIDKDGFFKSKMRGIRVIDTSIQKLWEIIASGENKLGGTLLGINTKKRGFGFWIKWLDDNNVDYKKEIGKDGKWKLFA